MHGQLSRASVATVVSWHVGCQSKAHQNRCSNSAESISLGLIKIDFKQREAICHTVQEALVVRAGCHAIQCYNQQAVSPASSDAALAAAEHTQHNKPHTIRQMPARRCTTSAGLHFALAAAVTAPAHVTGGVIISILHLPGSTVRRKVILSADCWTPEPCHLGTAMAVGCPAQRCCQCMWAAGMTAADDSTA